MFDQLKYRKMIVLFDCEIQFHSQSLKAFCTHVYINSALAIDVIDLFIAIYCSNGSDKSTIENWLIYYLLA